MLYCYHCMNDLFGRIVDNMKYRWDKKYLYWGVTMCAVVICGIAFYYMLFHIKSVSSFFSRMFSVLQPVTNGLILAYLLTPILNTIERKALLPACARLGWTQTKKSRRRVRAVSILFTLLFFFFIIYTLLWMIVPQILVSLQNIVQWFPSYADNILRYAGRVLEDYPEIEQLVVSYTAEIQNWLYNDVLPMANAMFNSLVRSVSASVLNVLISFWNLILGIIISVYLLGSKEVFIAQSKKIIYALFRHPRANLFIDNLRFTHKTFGGFISGKLLDSLIIGIICFVATSLIGTPYPVLVSVIIGVTNVIPFFGPYLGAVPTSFLILLVDPLQCLYFIIFILILQQFDGNILGPKILGDSTGLSSFWVIFSITLFGGIFGVFGMIIGVPTFAVIYAGIKALVGKSLDKKRMPTSTAAYMTSTYVEPMQEKQETRAEDEPQKI